MGKLLQIKMIWIYTQKITAGMFYPFLCRIIMIFNKETESIRIHSFVFYINLFVFINPTFIIYLDRTKKVFYSFFQRFSETPTPMSIFRNFILDIIIVCPEKQMFRIYASWVITFMEYVQSFFYRTIKQSIRITMCSHRLISTYRNKPISFFVFTTTPFPTAVNVVFFYKIVEKWFYAGTVTGNVKMFGIYALRIIASMINSFTRQKTIVYIKTKSMSIKRMFVHLELALLPKPTIIFSQFFIPFVKSIKGFCKFFCNNHNKILLNAYKNNHLYRTFQEEFVQCQIA